MKKLNILQLGFIFAGCFLGAGYVSGQELWQFFGKFGGNGFFGMALALICFFILGVMIIIIAEKRKTLRMDEIVVYYDNKILKGIIGFFQIFFMLGIYIIMCAGAGALINQTFGIPAIFGSGIFCIAAFLFALWGIDGVINIFSMFVPPLVAGAIITGIISMKKHGIVFGNTVISQKNPLIDNSFISAMVFVSYNIFSSIGILTPIAQKPRKKREIITGVLMGCILLFAISYSELFSMSSMSESSSAQLPMLFIANSISPLWGYIYAFLLIGAMFGTALSSLVAVLNFLREKYPLIKKRGHTVTLIISVCSWLTSFIGFAELIGTVYPICGYLGFFAIVSIIFNYINLKKNFRL